MSNIELREINKLIKEHFIIPTYQRGYRWTETQVTDLLEDVYEFIQNADIKSGEFYCLQPIVVKKESDGSFSVIDGQQRLTTIMIIQKYLGKRTYSIDYISRKGSSDFLNDIEKNASNSNPDIVYKNIDFFFMINAFRTIESWFEQRIAEDEDYSLPDEFNTHMSKYCKVIWYEVDADAVAENIFTRLNIGKIPLTNAELIKALFLRGSNYASTGNDYYLKQLEIANEWDKIEYTLNNDQLWYFINPRYSILPETRIEYLFDTISQNDGHKGSNYTFIYYFERFKSENFADIWKEVRQYFNLILEWYDDQLLFHIIGFLNSSRIKISMSELITTYYSYKFKKDEFVNYLNNIIREYFNNIEIDSLSYDDSADRSYIQDILLLFNTLTIMNKNNSYARFPFDSYNIQKWSIEHIHAQNTSGMGNTKDLWLAWIDEHIKSFAQFSDSKYHLVVNKLKSINRETLTFDEFDALFNELCEMIKDDYGTDLHNINNLALLDRNSNSSISNNFFDVKRNSIIEKDRNGNFIPICTRNVFLKYYSKDASQIHYWSKQDRDDYLNAIIQTLSDYLPLKEISTNE